MLGSYTKEPPAILKLAANEVRWNLLRALAVSDYRVQELCQLLQKPINLVSYHLRQLRNDSIVQEHRSAADGRDVYYAINLERWQLLYADAAAELHPALGAATIASSASERADRQAPTRVLFLCTHNSARSQMAEALLRHMADGRIEAFSAGTEATRVHPMAIETLERNSIDASGLSSKHLQQFIGQKFDYVITVCDNARESCPVFPGDPERIHWSFPDPSAQKDTDVQRIAFAEVFAGLEKRLLLLLALINHNASAA